MTLELQSALGLELVASGVARPREVGGRELDNRGVLELLLGERFEREHPRAELELAHATAAWGVERREWVRVARALDPARAPSTFDLCLRAARSALERSAIAAGELELLVAATATPPRISSSLASRLARELDTRALAIDLRAGGAGGLQAWVVAAQMLARGARTALVVAGECASLFLDARDWRSALLYGDGAAALVLRRDERASERGLVGALLGSERVPGQPFTVPGALPPTIEAVERGDYAFQAPDKPYREGLLAAWSLASRELAERMPRACESARAFVPYSVSKTQLEAACGTLPRGVERLATTLPRTASLGTASVFHALHELLEARKLAAGDVLLSTAIGGGVNRVALAWRL